MTLSPSHYVQQLRHHLGLTGPVNPYDVASALGIEVFEEILEACGYLVLVGGQRARILVNSGTGYETRKRFTVAHEIGHFYMPHHRQQCTTFVCSSSDLHAYRSSKALENEANEFASDLLLPHDAVDRYLDYPPTLATVKAIAENYGTSLTATAIKVARVSVAAVAFVLSQAGEVRWFVRSSRFRYWIRSGPLNANTHAYDYFDPWRCPSTKAEVVRGDAWCDNAGGSAYLVEESVPFDRLNMVLTMLIERCEVTDDDEIVE